SRFYYFKKNYGTILGTITETVLRINKNLFLLTLIILLGLFLRIYELSELMTFIGDQAWYYISARDMIVTGDIPLVGITSSHIWLHQGAYWTYLLVLLFKLFNFNPVVPAFFTAFLGTLTILIVYKLAREMLNERIALVSSFIFATSPLIVMDARFAYHTSPIPFFTALLLLLVFRWINDKVWYFPFVILLLAILYNLEIATFSLSGVVIFFLLSGLAKKKKWALGIINKKIILSSLVALFIPLIPFIIYDLKNGFPQTVKVVIWIIYRIAVFLGLPPLNPNAPGETWVTWLGFITELIRRLIFYPSTAVALIILGISFLFLFFSVIRQFKDKKVSISYITIFVSFFIPAVSYIGAKTNSGAYLLIFYPQVSIMLGILFGSKLKNKFFGQTLIFAAVLIGLVNTYSILKNNFNPGTSFSEKVEASKLIIRKASGGNYNVLGKGEGSEHESFTMPYEYLTWWLGHPPSGKNEKLKFYLNGNTDRIEFEKR
ncbi:MAG: Glycosyl transferase family 39, partial [Microgenomates group bacterium GW2011_GWA2_37_6]